jgi:dihydroflavonol-4-reductase
MVVVTGGTGFIGSYIIQELIQKGYPVRAIRRQNSHLPGYISREVMDRVDWVDGDVLDVVSLAELMENAETVIHAAAIVSFVRADRELVYQVNVQGTANVVNAALAHGVTRFVHISSVAALGRTPTQSRVNEEKKWQENDAHTHYAISKHKAEMEVWRGFAEGLQGVMMNPSTVLGFGNWNNSSCRIFKTAYDEFPWYTNGINGFVDVKDVARATVLLMEAGISEDRFILNGENWSFRRLLDAMADGFGKKHPRLHATPFLGGVAWKIEALKSLLGHRKPLLTKESARVAQSQTFFDNEKILGTLPGFFFTPLEISIKKSCENYLQAVKTGKITAA